MKPCSRKVLRKSLLSQEITLSETSTVASIKGSVRELGRKYTDARVVIYNKANLQLLAVRKPDENGDYQIFGLNTDLPCFIVGLDHSKQYNAVIQDNVVPK